MTEPLKITFIFADTYRTEVAITCEGEHMPYRRRSVTITLTPEQMDKITLKKVDIRHGEIAYEEIVDCFIENELKERQEDD